MSILTTVTSNLAGGVSQQGRSIRLDNQVLEQENGYSSAVDGLVKRPPTKFKRVLDDLDWANYTLHTFRRSEAEEYLVVAGHETLRVFDTEGVEYPVTGKTGSALQYLSLFDAQSGTLFETFDPFTFSGGPEVTPLDDVEEFTPPFSKNTHQAKVLVKAPGVLDVGEYTGVPLNVNQSPLLVWSLIVRATAASPLAAFEIGAKDGNDERACAKFQFQENDGLVMTETGGGASGGYREIGGGWWQVWCAIDQLELGYGYSRMYIGIKQASTDQSLLAFGPRIEFGVTKAGSYYKAPDNLRMTTVQDTTVLTNATVVPQLQDVVTEVDDIQPSVIWVRQGSYSTTYTVEVSADLTLTDITEFSGTVETWDGVDGTQPGGVNLNSIDTTLIATKLRDELRDAAVAATGKSDYASLTTSFMTIESEGSLVVIRPIASFFSIESVTTTDGVSDQGLSPIHESVTEISDLPKDVYFNEASVEITGFAGEVEDNYWVQFTTDDGEDFGSGAWSEIPAPGVRFEFNASTMPHRLVRTEDQFGSVFFQFEQVDWGDRLAGDEETVPPISPVLNESPIHEVFFYKNRLGFLSDQNVILSASGRYFDFWQASSRDLRDDDPIDVSVNSRDASRIDYAVEFFQNLILQTSEGQWTLSGGDSLTPRTVEAALLSSYESIPGVRPVSSGESLFLPYPRGGFSGVRELFPINDGRLTAADISDQVPRYIKGTALEMAASSVENVLLVQADGDRGCLWVYKWLNAGQDRVQSSWSKFTFKDAQVVAVKFIESVAYLLVRRSGSIQLECLDLTQIEGVDGELLVHLDRQLSSTHSQVSFVYDDVEEVTRITLPWNPGFSADYQVVTLSDGKAYKAYYTDVLTLEVEADITGSEFIVGERYLFDVTLAEPVFRQNNSRGGRTQVGEGRYQLLRGWLFCDDTGYVTVSNQSQGTSTLDEYGSAVSNAPFTDKLRIPLLCLSDETRLRLRNYSPYATRLTGFEWVGRFVTRAEGRAG